MIVLSTYKDKETNIVCVSHGIEMESGLYNIIILPNIPLFNFDYYFDTELQEYVLKK